MVDLGRFLNMGSHPDRTMQFWFGLYPVSQVPSQTPGMLPNFSSELRQKNNLGIPRQGLVSPS